MPNRRRAWVDESVRRAGVAEPMYLLGATITSPRGYETTSDVLNQYAPKGNKLHWRDLGDRGKLQIAESVATLDLEHVVIVRTLLQGMGEERARGLCLERLMWELTNRHVQHVTFESRSPTQDKADLRRIDGLRSQKILGPSIRADWLPGRTEPLLWAADIMVGLVGDAKAGSDNLPPVMRANITEIIL